MAPHPTPPAAHVSISDTALRRALGGMSVFTILMTAPQIWTIWVGHQAADVSILTWRTSTCPASAWIVADGAVIAGAIVYG